MHSLMNSSGAVLELDNPNYSLCLLSALSASVVHLSLCDNVYK